MAATKPKRTASDASPQAISLSELLGALSREFYAATVNHHATMNYWKQAYEDNPVLSEYHPLGMKIVSAQVSLPVAASQVTVNPPRVAQLTKRMIAEAIISDVPKSKRQDVARIIYAELAGQGKLSFSNSRLLSDIDELAGRNLPNTKNPLNKQYLSDLQRDFLAQPAGNSEISLLYRTKDLDQVKPELIFRINLDFKSE